MQQRNGHIGRAAEFARQRPIGLTVFDQQADIDLCTGRVFGELFQLFGGIGGKQANARAIGKGDVGGFLDGVAEGHARGTGPLRQAQLDLGARGGVEMRALGHQAGDHADFGVRLDGIVDMRRTQPGLQRVVLGGHGIGVDDQGRTVEFGIADEIQQPGSGRRLFGSRQAGYVCVHGHLQRTGPETGHSRSSGDVTVAT